MHYLTCVSFGFVGTLKSFSRVFFLNLTYINKLFRFFLGFLSFIFCGSSSFCSPFCCCLLLFFLCLLVFHLSSSPFIRANICALRIFPFFAPSFFVLPFSSSISVAVSLLGRSSLPFVWISIQCERAAQRNEPKWKCLNERLIGFWWISATHTHTHTRLHRLTELVLLPKKIKYKKRPTKLHTRKLHSD